MASKKDNKTPVWRLLIQVGMMVTAYAWIFTDIRPIFYGFSEFKLAFFAGLLLMAAGAALGVFAVAARRNGEGPSAAAPNADSSSATASNAESTSAVAQP